MKSKKIFIVIISILLAILGIVGLLWYGFNYYVIPKYVVSEIRNQIAIFNRDNGVDLKIQGIYYHPLRGFQLTGVELKPLLTAKEIDIDIDYFALLSKKVRLPQINIIEADLKVARSTKGTWNFSPVIKGLFNKGKSGQSSSSVVIDQISLSRGQVYFDDQLFKHNRLTKHFENVAIKINNPDREDYYVEASGSDVKKQDAIQFKFNYSAKTGLLKGRAQLKIANLVDYHEYYLDEIILPWSFTKARVAAQAEFSYCKGDFFVDGVYEVKNGKINYGDIKLAGNGSINHKQKYVKGNPKQSFLKAQVKLEGVSWQLEKDFLLEKVKCEAVLNAGAVQINKLQGISQGKPVNLTGRFVFQPVRRLDLAGKIGSEDNILHLKLLSDNAAQVTWFNSAEASYLRVSANIYDIKNLRFSGDVLGNIDLASLPGRIFIEADRQRLTVSFEATKSDISGNVGFAGKLQGELDKLETLSGNLGLKFKDISVLGLEPLSFFLGMKVKQGEFASAIPPMDLYKGKLSGALVLDAKGWGIELNIDDMDLAKFNKVDSQLAGLKGLLSGKMAAVGNWGKSASIWGGGVFNLTDADLQSVPIFSTAQQGVGSVVKGFEMPDFKAVKGNFEIANEAVAFSHTLAKAPDMELRGSGTIDFSSRANFIMGVKFLQQRELKTAMFIVFPVQMLGFDLLTKAVKVEIKGVIPDLKQTTTIQPLGWLTDTYENQSNFDPDRYTLKNLWESDFVNN